MNDNILRVTFNDDGSISVNATGMKGTEKSILAQLNSLASSLGGDLKVEKHVGHHHHHHHDHGHDHTHN